MGDALVKVGMSYSLRSQYIVKTIVCSCTGEDVTTLKNLIDGSGGYQNLHKLVYSCVRDDDIRDEIISHFSAQAHEVRFQNEGPIGIKLLSDIDDTILCSGGQPAGCDKQYPKKASYPG